MFLLLFKRLCYVCRRRQPVLAYNPRCMHGAVKVEVSDTVHNRKFSPAWLKYHLMLVVMQGRHEGLKNI